jgi:hypothetical protein
MNNAIPRSFAVAVAAILTLLPAISSAEQAGVQIGILACEVIPGSRVNLLIRSTADVKCTYDNKGTVERYNGEAGIALGVDLSFKTDEKFGFAVIAASSDVTPGAYALAGKYVGGQASAAAGVGVGARVLVGGGDKNFSLQPIGLEGSTGSIGATGGLGFLYIEKAN